MFFGDFNNDDPDDDIHQDIQIRLGQIAQPRIIRL